MNTPNNAAALERIEHYACTLRLHSDVGVAGAMAHKISDELLDIIEELRTLTQLDALTSQPSGEAVSIPVVQQTAPERIWLAVAEDAYYADKPFPDGEEVCWSSDAPLEVCVPYVRADLATHPSADAPGVAVDEALRGVCVRMLTFENSEYVPNVMFQQLRAALTEGGSRE